MDFIFLDYQTLRVIWWLLLGILLIGFAVMDGFDLGVGTLLPFVAKTDEERRLVLNTIGPVWEGNQVWLVLGGGAIFAAWPALYAVSFSGFYLAMFVVLSALILRERLDIFSLIGAILIFGSALYSELPTGKK